MQISEGVEESEICGRRHLFRIEVTLPEIRAPAAAYACQRAGRAKSQLGKGAQQLEKHVLLRFQKRPGVFQPSLERASDLCTRQSREDDTKQFWRSNIVHKSP
ncbi:hypothetical protein CDAR_510841 [Caerostris darwini]|uniref:Uncharacterized protein n=1 Tax=Caerostris darwini TaxID=1538125 RepID=A0AAV4T6M3_9ARAC|nr:hypothetical protein CDAR_510841 [Caerostris darwini]